MNIKIPIYTNFGTNPIPKGFISTKTGTAYLIDLANYIIQHADDPAIGIKSYTDRHGHVSYTIPHEIDGVSPSWVRVVIEDVDTSRPWEILDYDGSESIAYLDREFDEYNRAIS